MLSLRTMTVGTPSARAVIIAIGMPFVSIVKTKSGSAR